MSDIYLNLQKRWQEAIDRKDYQKAIEIAELLSAMDRQRQKQARPKRRLP